MMKRHVSAGLLFIVILCLLVGGAVTAYFTDEAYPRSAAEFQFGSVDIAVEKISDSGDTEITPPEETSGEVTWRITNTGSKKALLRVKVCKELEGDGGEYGDETETAWGVGSGVNKTTPDDAISPRFGGGNARYHVYTLGHTQSSPLELKLGYGANYLNAGSVSIWDDGDDIYVEVQTSSSWRLKETHLYVGSTAPNSPPGHLGNERHPMSTSVSYQLPLPSGIQDNQVYIALHAAIQERIGGDSGTAPDISLDAVSGWEKGSNGYYYYLNPVSPGGTVDFELSFDVEGFWSGECELYLEAQAVQASNNAIDAVWPDHP